MTVLTLKGKELDWDAPRTLKPTMIVKWSDKDMYGREVKGSLRTIAQLDLMSVRAKRRFNSRVVIIQPPFNTSVAASAGTHDFDACMDWYIPGLDWWRTQRFGRWNGQGCWYRHAPLFGNHIHGFVLPPREGQSISDDFKVHGYKVGKYVDGGYGTYGRLVTSSQLADYYNRAFGLSNQHTYDSDKSWHPGRTKGGIEATLFDLPKYITKKRLGRF